jgi:hypothetical protein
LKLLRQASRHTSGYIPLVALKDLPAGVGYELTRLEHVEAGVRYGMKTGEPYKCFAIKRPQLR